MAQDRAAHRTVGALCLITAVQSYAGGTGGLLTETLPYAARVYHVGDPALGVGLAVVRVGVLLALGAALLADRHGRRRLIVPLAASHCLLAGAIALAPTFALYVGGHVFLRSIDVVLGVAIFVLAVECTPAANRAVVVSLILMASGLGAGLAVLVLPLAAAGRLGLGACYGLGLLGLPLVLRAGRYLPESPRFLGHAAEPHRYRELLSGRYRRALVLVGSSSLLTAVFLAPTAEFFNRYLQREQGLTAPGIVVFLAVTGIPAFFMLPVGGRLADVYGRKVVGVPLVVVSALCLAGFYLVSSPWIWPLVLIGGMSGSAGGAALSVYGVELFPTRVRAAANVVLVIITVLGSGAGLVAAGVLSGALGLGPAIAVLVIAPLAGAVVVVLGFPETVGRDLDETSGDGVVTLRRLSM